MDSSSSSRDKSIDPDPTTHPPAPISAPGNAIGLSHTQSNHPSGTITCCQGQHPAPDEPTGGVQVFIYCPCHSPSPNSRERSRSPQSHPEPYRDRVDLKELLYSSDSAGDLTEIDSDDSDFDAELVDAELSENTDDKMDVTDEHDVRCEFAGTCHMETGCEKHFRKIISHVFGRNKAATKCFPPSVWVLYCRKHYQRARYRAVQWPFTQCDLLIESLRRMEEWGGVVSFRLILRRREQERVNKVDEDTPTRATALKRHAACRTRRNPCPVSAPVPHWLRERTASGLTFDDIREIIGQIRQHMEDQRRSQENVEQVEDVQPAPSNSDGKANKKKKGSRASPQSSSTRAQRTPIRFPDIEIIPTFKPWALKQHEEAQKLKKQKTKDKSGVKKKGGVRKP